MTTVDCEIIDCWLVEGGGAILKLRVPPSAVKIGGVYPLLREADDNCRPVRVTLPNAHPHGRAPARTVQGVVGSLDGDK